MARIIYTMVNRTLQLDEKTVGSKELLWMKKLFELSGHEVQFVSNISRNNVNLTKDYNEVDYNNYDVVIVHNSLSDCPGGYVKSGAFTGIRKLINYKGPLRYVITDPHLFNFNTFKGLYKRKNNPNYEEKQLTQEENEMYFERWHDKDAKAFWIGEDYQGFCSTLPEHYLKLPLAKQFNLFGTYYAENGFPKTKINFDVTKKTYDLFYHGSLRHERRKKFDEFFGRPDLKTLIIGMKQKQIDKSKIRCEKLLPHKPLKEIYPMFTDAVATLTPCDKGHALGKLVTSRYIENMGSGAINFIHTEFDPQKRLVKDETLKNYLYVDNVQQVYEKINELKNNPEKYTKLLKLQLKDIENYLAQYKFKVIGPQFIDFG